MSDTMKEFNKALQKLSDSGVTFSAHTIEGWTGQYERMLRFYHRTINADNDIDKLDYALTFFQNCFHLKDWIPVIEQIDKLDWKKKWEKFISTNQEMKLCRDICNGSKHLKLTNPSINKYFALLLEYEPYNQRLGKSLTEWKLFTDGQKYSLIELMQACIRSWDNFIKTELI